MVIGAISLFSNIEDIIIKLNIRIKTLIRVGMEILLTLISKRIIVLKLYRLVKIKARLLLSACQILSKFPQIIHINNDLN
jgi:hypothetical protein